MFQFTSALGPKYTETLQSMQREPPNLQSFPNFVKKVLEKYIWDFDMQINMSIDLC